MRCDHENFLIHVYCQRLCCCRSVQKENRVSCSKQKNDDAVLF